MTDSEKLCLEWAQERSGQWVAHAGRFTLVAWCSAPGWGYWEIVDDGRRAVLVRPPVQGCESLLDAQLAAERAARDLLCEALAKFGRESPDSWLVHRVGDCVQVVEGVGSNLAVKLPLLSRATTTDLAVSILGVAASASSTKEGV